MWKEGARVNCPTDVCPGCGANAPHFASDFKALGKKSLVVCVACQGVFVNGKRMGDLEVHILPKESSVPS